MTILEVQDRQSVVAAQNAPSFSQQKWILGILDLGKRGFPLLLTTQPLICFGVAGLEPTIFYTQNKHVDQTNDPKTIPTPC